jgi:hypothetical protein
LYFIDIINRFKDRKIAAPTPFEFLAFFGQKKPPLKGGIKYLNSKKI